MSGSAGGGVTGAGGRGGALVGLGLRETGGIRSEAEVVEVRRCGVRMA